MAGEQLYWRDWTVPEKDLFRALSKLREAPTGPNQLASVMSISDDHVGRTARAIMHRLGIAARLRLTARQRYEELWLVAVAWDGVPSPPPTGVDWIMNLTTESTILGQFRKEGKRWVIDQCVNLQTIFEFRGVSESSVRSRFIGPMTLPDRLLRIRYSNRKPGRTYWEKYSLRGFSPVESDIVDAEGLTLTFGRMDWLDVETFSLGLSSLLLKNEYQGPLLQLSSAEIPCFACVHVILITADGKVVAARRAVHKNYHPLSWSFSFEEQMNATPRHHSQKADQSPFDTVVEGAWEEFHVHVSRESIRLLSICLELPNYAADLVAIARCAETSDQIWSCWQQASDKGEHDCVVALDPQLESLAPQFFRPDPAPELDDHAQWHPTSRMRLLAFLAHRWGLGQTLSCLSALREEHAKPQSLSDLPTEP